METYALDRRRGRILRTVKTLRGSTTSAVPLLSGNAEDENLANVFDASWLRATQVPSSAGATKGRLRVVDVFSGCGGLSLGVAEAARACGYGTEHALAIDVNADALRIFTSNFPEAVALNEDITEVFAGKFGDALTPRESAIAAKLGLVDFLVGGPPCQGHSSLNNHTRQADPRNSLFLHMARCAEVLRPRFVVIENVPGVVHDKSNVVHLTRIALESLGYQVSMQVLRALEVGVPQARTRFVLIARRANEGSARNLLISKPKHTPRTFAWACADLVDTPSTTVFDSAANHSETNQRRIKYLFDNDLYDLPNEQRPDCHRLKAHSYNAVYGRLKWDQPVPTITRGFGSTGQGRFVHPTRQRSLTPHEAARLQFFPDFFSFSDVKRYSMQIIIGNAVPSKLAYAVGISLLSGVA